MKLFSLLAVLFCFQSIHAKTSSDPFSILRHLENCYDKMIPAAEKSEETFAWFSEIPHPLFNSVMHLRSKDTAEKIDALIAKAPTKNLISFWVHPENRSDTLVSILKKKGFSSVVTCPLMFWKVSPVQSDGFDICSSEEDLVAFDEITTEIFHLNPSDHKRYFEMLKKLDLENYLIYSKEGDPIGVGTLLVQGKVGGIFSVGILPSYQKKGYGRAMMHYLMNRAHKLSLEKLVLLSSLEAEKFYQDLGFQTVFDVDIYAQ